MPKLPVPSEATDFRFLVSDNVPEHAVLESDTLLNPVRVFLSKTQIERLAIEAQITRKKMDG